jgi:hypothetical protein
VSTAFEYLLYFLTAALFATFSYLSRGVFGIEHLLSTWQVSLGHIPCVDFFEHHGPLQYYLFAPVYSCGGYKLFSVWLILINSSIVVLLIYYFTSLCELTIRTRILFATTIVWLWTILLGSTFMPEPYITLFVILSYQAFVKINSHKRYLFGFGVLLSLIMLIKFTAFFFMLFSLLLYCIFNFKTDTKIVTFSNVLYFLMGSILPILPFIAIYHDNFKELIYWNFTYNLEVAAPLGRYWPPSPFSLLFLILVVNISILSTILMNRSNGNNYCKVTFPIISSTCLLLLAYPRYDDSHLLPAIVGCITGIVFFFREGIHLSIIHSINCSIITYKTYILKVIASLIVSHILFLVGYSIVSFSKLTYRMFWPSPGSYYHAEFPNNSLEYIENKEQCNYVYIYPADGSNLLMNVSLPKSKSIGFLYPNWSWTFTNEIQNMILEELISKQVDCVLIPSNYSKDVLRSKVIEKYISNNYSMKGEVVWNVYSFKTLLPFAFVTDYGKNYLSYKYSLFRLNTAK